MDTNVNTQEILDQVKLDMYGHDVGAEVTGVYGHKTDRTTVVILEKKAGVVEKYFSYLVQGKDDTNYVGAAMTDKDGNVLIFNARIIGSDDPAFGVDSMEQARSEVWL
jgi:hypothetical protein